MRFLSIALMSVFVILSTPVFANSWFTVGDYKELKARDIKTAHLVLKAMREAVFYAQESIGGPVICVSPKPIDGAQMMKLLEAELSKPTNKEGQTYTAGHQVAYVLLNALKGEGVCK